jgi:hypothetical protein
MRKPKKKTVANDNGREINAFKSRYKVTPLEYMLKIINSDQLPMELRCDMAAAAAPFLHQKLRRLAIDEVAGLEKSGPEKTGPEKNSLDLSKLTSEELKQFKQLLAKAK